MQTFIPERTLTESAQVLDRLRLGKQRLEALDILGLLTDFGHTGHTERQQIYLRRRYRNHPAVKMWRGAEVFLACYGAICCIEWQERGYTDTRRPYFEATLDALRAQGVRLRLPPWWGDPAVHQSHRRALLYKNPEHYRRFWPDQRPELAYVWPEGYKA